MDSHLTDDHPKDDSRPSWMREDARLFFTDTYSIDSEVVVMVTHCGTIKELMNYL